MSNEESINQAGIEVHADKLSVTSGFAAIAGQPNYKFDVADQTGLATHSVIIGKTAEAHKLSGKRMAVEDPPKTPI